MILKVTANLVIPIQALIIDSFCFVCQVYLIEVNVNPCLARNCEALKDVVTETVQETIRELS